MTQGKVPICPRCGKELHYIKYDEKGVLDWTSGLHAWELGEGEPTTTYSCPECDTYLDPDALRYEATK